MSPSCATASYCTELTSRRLRAGAGVATTRFPLWCPGMRWSTKGVTPLPSSFHHATPQDHRQNESEDDESQEDREQH